MKKILILLVGLLLLSGCIDTTDHVSPKKDGRRRRPMQQSRSKNQIQKQDNISVTLKGMFCNDFSPNKLKIAHPLICHKTGDYPGGTETIFVKQSNPKQWVHAVFPKSLKAPKNLKKQINLQGYFQKIQNQNSYGRRRQHVINYEYFVVSSWEYQK